jgi:hypothetical protein
MVGILPAKVNVFSTGQAGKIPTISKSMYSLLVKQVKYQPSHPA